MKRSIHEASYLMNLLDSMDQSKRVLKAISELKNCIKTLHGRNKAFTSSIENLVAYDSFYEVYFLKTDPKETHLTEFNTNYLDLINFGLSMIEFDTRISKNSPIDEVRRVLSQVPFRLKDIFEELCDCHIRIVEELKLRTKKRLEQLKISSQVSTQKAVQSSPTTQNRNQFKEKPEEKKTQERSDVNQFKFKRTAQESDFETKSMESVAPLIIPDITEEDCSSYNVSTCEIFKVRVKKEPETFIILKLIVTDDENSKKMAEKESNKMFDHPNIVKQFDSIKVRVNDIPATVIAIEFCKKGDLKTRKSTYNNKKHNTENLLWQILKQCCRALMFLYSQNMTLHRDVKPENIFIYDFDHEFITIKLGDFGISRSEKTMTIGANSCGTISYMAPEVKENKLYSTASDIYSLGVTIAESCDDLGKYSNLETLVRRMTSIEPIERPTYEEILDFPIFQAMMITSVDDLDRGEITTVTNFSKDTYTVKGLDYHKSLFIVPPLSIKAKVNFTPLPEHDMYATITKGQECKIIGIHSNGYLKTDGEKLVFIDLLEIPESTY